MNNVHALERFFRRGRVPEGPLVAEERSRIRSFLSEYRAAGGYSPRCDNWLSGFSAEFSRELGARGWIGITWPPVYGGRGMPATVRYVVIEELLAAGAPVAAHWFADRQVGPSILRHGSDRLKERFLPRMAAGNLYFCIGMSEPGAGSDLGSVRLRARHTRGRWRLSGSKIWTSHADRSHFMLALARTGEIDEPPHSGLTQFIVDMSAPGISVRSISGMAGEAHFCEVFFDDVPVPDDMVLGEVGKGWHQVLSELAYERSGPERFLSTFPLLSAFAEQKPSSAGQSEDWGRIVARLIALRAMSRQVNEQLDGSRVTALAAAMVKDLGTALEHDSIEALRRHALPAPLRQLLREAQAHAPNFTLRGGTTEILRNIIGKAVVEHE